MPKNKAIFLDRDGVINAEVGYIYKPKDIQFIDGIFDFCRKAQALGYLLIVVSNQSGISRGLYTEEDFHALMGWMQERFKKEGCAWTAYYFCPHHPEHGRGAYKIECSCRKPKPGMILQAAKEWDIDLGASILIGDQERDLEAGRGAGIKTLWLYQGLFPIAALNDSARRE